MPPPPHASNYLTNSIYVDSIDVLGFPFPAPLPHNAATWLDADDEAMFALANAAGNITLIKMGNMRGIVTSNSLKSSSYLLGRLWGNFGSILSRGGGASSSGSGGGVGGLSSGFDSGVSSEAAVSMIIHSIQSEVYVFALCKDHKVRMWLASTQDCVMASDILAVSSVATSCAGGGSPARSTSRAKSSADITVPLQQGAQCHLMKKVHDNRAPCRGSSSCNEFAIAVFLCFSQHSQFCVFRPVRSDGRWQLDHLATVFSPDYDLIDFSVTPAGQLVALWTNPDGIPVLRYAMFGGSHQSSAPSATFARGVSAAAIGDSSGTGWSNVALEEPLYPDFQPPKNSNTDLRQSYLHQLFSPGRFSFQTLAKTVGVSSFVSLDHIVEYIYAFAKQLQNEYLNYCFDIITEDY